MVGTGVGGNAFAFEENLDGGGGDFGVDGFADQAAGNAVIVGVDVDVVVDIDFGPLPVGEFVGAGREGEGGGAVEFVEDLPTGLLDFAEGAVVEGFEEWPNGGVHFGEGMEDAVTENGKDPAFGNEYAVFHLGLVAGPPGTGRKNGGGVVVGHVLVGRVEGGFVKAGFEDTAFEIIGNQKAGDDPKIGEGAGVGADPVGECLGEGGLGVGEGGGAPDGDEELGEGHFAGDRVGKEEAIGVIDEELVAGFVGLAHDEFTTGKPFVIEPAKGGVLIAGGML